MSDKKDTNPKDAAGIAKAPLSTLSPQVMGEVGVAMLEGALKYGRHNYRVAGVRASVYYDACLRHLNAWFEGQDIDPDSGLSHIVKAMACLMVVRDSQLQDNWVDDRPPAAKDPNWQKGLNDRVKALLAKYPDPVEPWTNERFEREHPQKGFNERVTALLAKYPNPVEPWTNERFEHGAKPAPATAEVPLGRRLCQVCGEPECSYSCETEHP